MLCCEQLSDRGDRPIFVVVNDFVLKKRQGVHFPLGDFESQIAQARREREERAKGVGAHR